MSVAAFVESWKVTDGARTRNLLISHNPMQPVTVRPAVSGYPAYLRVFGRFAEEVCPLRTSLYQLGCITVAVLPGSSVMAPMLIPRVEYLLPSPAVRERVN